MAKPQGGRMEGQHIENLFRRLKGEVVHIKCISGATYEGKVIEVTNDYVCLSEPSNPQQPVYLFFTSIESMSLSDPAS